jgi:hypothetical protein
MNTAMVLALVLASIVALSLLRLAVSKTAGRMRQRFILALLGIISAVCLYFTLQPPAVWVPAAERLIESAHADALANKPKGLALALPEAAPSAAPRIPDVATALRQQSGIQRLHVLGDGLPARDREAVRGIPLRFTASPVPAGLVEFWQTESITEGAPWQVLGRVHGHKNASLEWLDPAGVMQARLNLPASGNFAFKQMARAQGRVLYELRLRAANGTLLESFRVPVWVQAARVLRVQSVAGAPNAELKTLRRWLLDSGQTLRSRIDLAPAFTLENARVDLSPAGLASTDVLLLDERAWQNLSAGQRQNIRAAVNAGLGVLLRITGPLANETRADFQQMGIQIAAAELPQAIKLENKAEAIELSRQPVQVNAAQGRVLLESAQEQTLALSKPLGQGRVAVLWLADSYRLALAGSKPQYGHLWSALFSDIARPYERSGPTIMGAPHWQSQRLVICNLDEGASVVFANTRTTLLPEAIGPLPGCAGFWPQTPGWHGLQSGAHRLWFYVHQSTQGKALQRQQTRLATQALVANQVAATKAGSEPVPGSPWPWFVAWLLASGLLWWLERRHAAKRV